MPTSTVIENIEFNYDINELGDIKGNDLFKMLCILEFMEKYDLTLKDVEFHCRGEICTSAHAYDSEYFNQYFELRIK